MTRLSTITVPGSVATANNTLTFSNKTLANVTITGAFSANGSTGSNGQILTSNGTGVYWGTSGASGNGAIWENNANVVTTYTMSTGKNGVSVGPLSIANGSSITVPSGSRWVVL